MRTSNGRIHLLRPGRGDLDDLPLAFSGQGHMGIKAMGEERAGGLLHVRSPGLPMGRGLPSPAAVRRWAFSVGRRKDPWGDEAKCIAHVSTDQPPAGTTRQKAGGIY